MTIFKTLEDNNMHHYDVFLPCVMKIPQNIAEILGKKHEFQRRTVFVTRVSFFFLLWRGNINYISRGFAIGWPTSQLTNEKPSVCSTNWLVFFSQGTLSANVSRVCALGVTCVSFVTRQTNEGGVRKSRVPLAGVSLFQLPGCLS